MRALLAPGLVLPLVVALVVVSPPAAAQAEDAIAVLPAVSRTFPDSGSVIPTNARPIAFAPQGAGITLELVRANGTRAPVPFTEAVADTGAALLLDLQSGGPLVAGEVLTLEQPDCGGACQSFGWTVGDADDVTPPTFDEGQAAPIQVVATTDGGIIPVTSFYEIDTAVPPARDDGGDVQLRVEGDEGLSLFMAPGSNQAVHFFVPGGDVRTYCFRVIAVDNAGNETELAEELCADFATARERGCASTSSSSALGLLASLALLSRRTGRARRSRP